MRRMTSRWQVRAAHRRPQSVPQIPPAACGSLLRRAEGLVWPRADLHVDFNEKLVSLVNRLTWRSSWPERSVGMLHSWRGEAPSKREAVARFADEESLRSLEKWRVEAAAMGQEEAGAGEEAEGFALAQPPPSARARDGRAAQGGENEQEEKEEERATQP